MNVKTGSIISASLLTVGVVIGAFVHKDHTVTQLVGVPVRVMQPAVAVVSPIAPTVTFPQTPVQAEPVVPVVPAVQATYVAQKGDTLSNVATGLLGADTKANRDTVVSASPSLKANPDLVVTGREYSLSNKTPAIVPVETETVPPAKQAVVVDPTPAPVASTPAAPVMKYTAAKGDTVTNLASSLLGADTQANRDAIINANPSLKADPDHLLAGKAYRIVTPEGGLTAAPVSPVSASVRPTTQPDADQLVHDDQSRSLRYTAKSGDTVGGVALSLLGSDNAANCDAIVNANASLKDNPDMMIAGKTYWIPAPVAAVAR